MTALPTCQPLPALYCGDCLDVLPTLGAGIASMIFCDLPYGITRHAWDVKIPLERLWAQLLRVGTPGCVFVFTATQPFASELVQSRVKLFRYDLIWDKCVPTGHLNAKRRPLRRHETVLIFCAKAPAYTPQMTTGKPYLVKKNSFPCVHYGKSKPSDAQSTGPRYPVSILRWPVVRQANPHSVTPKPIGLLEFCVRTYSQPGDTVLDPVMGTAATGAACYNSGRDFIGIEKNPAIFADAQRRLLRLYDGD